jgi:hypothetical protein
MTITTNTKTFGKESKKLVNKIFPTAKSGRVSGSKMRQFINFYDENDNCLGYWTNEGKEKGYFRKF